ncbi:MAG: hypothetical protein KF773_03915 [Deltaproteobacteria bacterium]|nr:hypothetical protein [Deltaproteobacteria bacterium]
MRSGLVLVLTLAVVLASAATASATPPEPSGKHPRILLDDKLRTAWKQEVADGRGPVIEAIKLCESGRTHEHDRALYQGAEWNRVLQACLVAWAATDKQEHAATAQKFLKALLDDLDDLNDGKGGDKAASRDDGYAIRNLGPFTAVAYDWLHGQLPDDLKVRARMRWQAWMAWWKDKGYRRRAPGSNYHAGYLLAATMIGVAQGSEAGESGAAHWAYVADEMWAKDMAAALSTSNILDGGDWPEGWQYGPLAVASYALAARVAKQAGITVEGVSPWLESVLRRHVYGLNPSDKYFAAGDAEPEVAYLPPHVLVLAAVALGDAPTDDKKWAKGELSRLKIADKDYLFYDSLATIGDPPAYAPREKWPTWYLATNTATIYARTRWDPSAVWFVAECAHSLLGADGENIDHRHPNTGNFVLSRGTDDVIVDPSPYGALSTLTGNAPTVRAKKLPDHYEPSQGVWGEKSGWRWATQTKGGVVAARCDYADQFKFQHRATEIDEALRDFVLLPSADGTSTALVVVDRANTGDGDQHMYLRFRTPSLGLEGDTGAATIGGTKLTIAGLSRTSGAPALGRPTQKDCFKQDTVRGTCDAARFPVVEYRVELDGPEPLAVHVIGATDAKTPVKSTKLGGDGWAGVHVTGPRDAVVVWPHKAGGDLAYRAPKGKAVTHVVLAGPQADGNATIAAKAEGNDCAVTVTAGGATPAAPAILVLDDACAVTVDRASPSAASAVGTKPAAIRSNPKSKRTGCCDAQGAPSSLVLALGVVLLVVRRRRPA